MKVKAGIGPHCLSHRYFVRGFQAAAMQGELQDALHWSRSNLSQHNLARDKLMTLSMTAAALHCVQLTCSLLSESIERPTERDKWATSAFHGQGAKQSTNNAGFFNLACAYYPTPCHTFSKKMEKVLQVFWVNFTVTFSLPLCDLISVCAPLCRTNVCRRLSLLPLFL